MVVAKKLVAVPAMLRRFKATKQVADMAEGALLDHSEWLELNEQREALRHKIASFFQDYDVLLMPVVPTIAIHHQQSPPVPPPQGLVKRYLTVNGERRSYFDIFFWISTATVLYLPATVAPLGQNSEGLPFGVQIIGAQYHDRTTIDFARRLEHLTGGFEPPPDFVD